MFYQILERSIEISNYNYAYFYSFLNTYLMYFLNFLIKCIYIYVYLGLLYVLGMISYLNKITLLISSNFLVMKFTVSDINIASPIYTQCCMACLFTFNLSASSYLQCIIFRQLSLNLICFFNCDFICFFFLTWGFQSIYI